MVRILTLGTNEIHNFMLAFSRYGCVANDYFQLFLTVSKDIENHGLVVSKPFPKPDQYSVYRLSKI